MEPVVLEPEIAAWHQLGNWCPLPEMLTQLVLGGVRHTEAAQVLLVWSWG